MSVVFSCLQRIDPAHAANDAIVRHCRRHGADPGWDQASSAEVYLRFTLERGGAAMSCLIQADDWIAVRLPHLGGLAWAACDVRTSALIFGASSQPLNFMDPLFDYDSARFDGIERPLRDITLPSVESSEGRVLLAGMPWDAADHGAPISLPGDLALAVSYQLPALSLSRRQLSRLQPHDVVLLPSGPWRAYIGARAFFTFNLDGEHITVNDIFSYPDERQAPLAPMAQAASLDLAALPISIDVVLCRVPHTLAQLGDLQAGAVFALPPDAHRQLELLVNGQRVAGGELVQVGDGLGVQITAPPVNP